METLRLPQELVHVTLEHGKHHEDLARKQFVEETGKQVINEQ